jgi:hypothetical protein
MKIDRRGVVGGILGAFGAWFGFMIGSGIELSWHGILLGIFISIMGIFVLASQTPFLSSERLGELMFGTLVGLAAEAFILRSIYLALFLGAIAGVLITPITQYQDLYIAELRAKYAPRARLVLGILLLFLGLAAGAWAYPKGILKEVTIVSLVILVTMFILLFGKGNQKYK